jgi:magnesium transporter
MRSPAPEPPPRHGLTRQVNHAARALKRFVRRSPKAPGASPDLLVPSGEKRMEEPAISCITYDAAHFSETIPEAIDAALPLAPAPAVTWINIDGLHDVALMETIGAHFGIHSLTREDIFNTGQRPKVEEFEGYLFMVFKMLYLGSGQRHIEAEQVSVVLGDNFLLSFQEIPGDVLAPVRERLKRGKGRIRTSGPEYLAYALIDAVVDHYFVLLETLGDKIETLEQELLGEPTPGGLQQLYDLKRELIFFRKQVWPTRELLSRLTKEDSPFIDPSVRVFFNDVYDHTIQVIDTLESFRDLLSGLLDVYLSTVSNRMNEIMKVLTIIATIFIPLSFVAGIYGMNFEYMPELKWRWAYPALLGVLLGIFCGMLFWLKRQKWL